MFGQGDTICRCAYTQGNLVLAPPTVGRICLSTVYSSSQKQTWKWGFWTLFLCIHLQSLVSHKSRLERDKEAALASKAYEKSDRRPQQCKVPSDKVKLHLTKMTAINLTLTSLQTLLSYTGSSVCLHGLLIPCSYSWSKLNGYENRQDGYLHSSSWNGYKVHVTRLNPNQMCHIGIGAYGQSFKSFLQDLGSILIKHKSKLEVEKEKAKAANQPANESQPRYMRSTVASRYATQANKGSLEDSLTVHRSRLERERDAARRDPKPRLRAKVPLIC